MATQVYRQEDISLQDGTDVTLKPLPIATLRRFMAAWGRFADLEEGDDGFQVFVNCAGIALESQFKDKFDNFEASAEQKKKNNYLSNEYKAYLESVLDIETIYRVLDVCGGLKLDDPKLLEAAEALAVQDGTN